MISNNQNSITSRKFLKNVGISILAQILSLVVSILINLFVPKYIDEYQYAYWQSYILYVSYVGIFHFGLLDGIMLRYSQYDYDELDKERIRSQFKLLILLNTILAIIALVGVLFFTIDTVIRNITFFVAIGIISKNQFTYASYTYQMTNRINLYVKLVITQKIIYVIAIIFLLFGKVQQFQYLCIVDVLADFISIAFLSKHNKELYFGKSLSIKDNIKEFKLNISSGSLLLIANWASMLLVGEAKMFVQNHWDALVFGKVSFAFSVSNLFLTFVTAVSIVLFPSLKRMNKADIPRLYSNIRNTISPLLFFLLLFYFPGCWFLQKWLPKYTVSLSYLGLLLPLIVFTSKVSLLTNNYLKAYRRERQMLKINFASIAIGTCMYTVTAFIFDNLLALLVATVMVIMFRAVYSEMVVMKLINASFLKQILIEAVLTVLFIVCTRLPLFIGFITYVLIYVVYCFLNREVFVKLVKIVYGHLL